MTLLRCRWLALAAPLVLSCARPAAEPELVLHNGRIFTADSALPFVEAIVIQGERIIAVGANAEMLSLAGESARRVDLGGKTVVPGFNDAHDHIVPEAIGVTFATGTSPLPDPAFALVRDSLTRLVARTPPGTWLRTYVGERVLSDRTARRAAIDAVAPDHPVELLAWTGHGMVFNSQALAALGVGEEALDPLGGRYERGADGRLTGLVEEYAGYASWRRAETATDSAIAAAFQARGSQTGPFGITSIQNMVTGMPPDVVARVIATVELPYRLRLIPLPLTTTAGRDLAPWPVLRAASSPRIAVSGVKWILDGTPVERLAALRSPYSDRPGWFGRLNFPPDTLRAILREAAQDGQQPILHAVGDSAIGLALQLMTEVAPDSVWQRLRPRIEHGEGLSPDQLPLARRLGVILVQNPSHFDLGGTTARDRYGRDRLPILQPMRSALAAGIPVAIGSDGPLSPFLNLMLAVLHPNNPAEALSMEQAVTAYTAGSAYAEHAEGQKGRLMPGLAADLAVLSQDIFTVPPPGLLGTTSLLTLVGGRVVHDPGGLVPLAPAGATR